MHILQWEYMVIHCTLLIKKTEGKRIGIMVYWVDLERAASLGNSYFGGLPESFLLLHLRSISRVRGNKNCFYQNKCNLLACFRCVLNKVIENENATQSNGLLFKRTRIPPLPCTLFQCACTRPSLLSIYTSGF